MGTMFWTYPAVGGRREPADEGNCVIVRVRKVVTANWACVGADRKV